MPELDDRELAALVRARLQSRQPRRLPERFVPPARRPHRGRWALVTAMAAIVLGLAATAAVRPELGPAVLSGLADHLPGAHAGSPAPALPGGRPARPSRPPQGQGAGTATSAPGSPGPTPGPSGGGLPVPLPSLPPLPVPTPSVPPLPLPTPSLPPLP